MSCPYNSYSSYLLRRYGYRIFRVGVDAGFSCPNRMKNPSGEGCAYCDSLGARASYQRYSESEFHHDSSFVSTIDTMAQNTDKCTNNLFLFSKEDIIRQSEKGLSFLKTRYGAEHFAFYLQSFSNTFAPCEKLKELYDFVLSLHSWEGFIVSTRPDCIDEKKLELLESYKKKGLEVCVELGLQSGDDEILTSMNRGHDVNCFFKAAKAVKAHGLSLCVHILTGFPGEGKAELDKTVFALNYVHSDALKIHNLNIVAGTELYRRLPEGEITAPCMTRHLETVSYILRRIPSDIVIERLMCETPNHRLASPRLFPDKNIFLRKLEALMEKRGWKQGDLCQKQ